MRDNADLLARLSGALKVVSLVAGVLSFVPVLAPIMGPIALGTALVASAIDLSIYAATGQGSLRTILIDVGLNLLPGVGKLARMGAGTLRGTRVATAFSSVAQRGRNMLSVARWGLSNPRLNGIEAARRLVRLDPIDIATGAMVLSQTDVELAGALPLVLSRTHISSYRLGSWFGRSWASTLDQRLEADHDGVYVTTADGMTLIYPPGGADGAPVLPVEGPRWPLRHADGGYAVTDPWRGHTWHYRPVAADPAGQWPLAAMTDRNGHRVDIHRTGDGTPVEVVHSGGYRVGVDTEDNRVVGLRLGDTVLLRFGYNEFGDLTEVINSSGLPQRFEYDIEGRATAWIDRNGTEYRYTYDEAGRCVATQGTGGYLSGQIRYDPAARTTTVVDSLGHATVYQLNELAQTESVTDPLGNSTHYTWDRYDRKLSETDPLGRTTRYSYSEAGDLVEVVRADGCRATADYNHLHQPTRQTGFDGATWHREYDGRGNLVRITDPLGAATTYSCDSHGRLTGVAIVNGDTITVECDDAGLPAVISDPVGATTRYRRKWGRITSITDPLGRDTLMEWTLDGRRTSRVLPNGTIERWHYDPEGNLRAHLDAARHVTRFEAGPFDRTGAQVQPDGSRLTFHYDTELRLSRVTNPQGLAWRYEYDAAGRMVAETDFNGRTLTYAYDAAGQLITRTNGLGQCVRFEYDRVGNIVRQWCGDAVTAFTYDAAGRVVRATNADAEVVFSRDPLGRVIAEACNGRVVTGSYDLLGRRIRRQTPSGVASEWTFDAGDQPAQLRMAGHLVHFDRDPAGRETRRRLDGYRVVSQTWDFNSRLASQEIGAAGGRRSFTYRSDGYLTELADDHGGIRRFDLDFLGRVTEVRGDTWSETYAYDSAGNVVVADWPGGEASPAVGSREYAGTIIRRAGKVRYEHDSHGRMVVRECDTASGPVTWRFTWDGDDRLTAVAAPDGSRWRYAYDPFGRRIAKQRYTDEDSEPVEEFRFTWDGVVLAEQSDASGTTTWEWEPNSFRPVAQHQRTEHDESELFYAVVTNAAGTPTELIGSDGTVTWRANHNVWGAPLSSPNTGSGFPLRFPGQYHDAETGHNYNLFRYYDPTVGRYQTADPLGLAGGTNPHSYVSNPGFWTDPLGLTPYSPDSPVGTVVNERGVRVVIHSNDHPPPHAHVIGGGPETRIGQNGHPLQGDPELSRRQADVIDANRQTIRDAIGEYMRWFRDQAK